ncbi:MAG TPA: hypothetical protein VES39_09335 [Rhodospirillales bacterium]|nr:hypothetical protein [Rhodospirillales bacterium]
MRAAVLSPGIRRIPHLQAFLPEFDGIDVASIGSATSAVLGWGYKATSRRARAMAERHALPYVALEDGFLRSFGLGCEGEPPLSLVVDADGIHYDAARPSRLERLLEDGGWETPELLSRAERCARLIRANRLSKYNAAPARDLRPLLPAGRRVLVVDQTYGDESIVRGGASGDTFLHMLDTVEAGEPGAAIVVKTHPDVAAGRKRGHLTEEARRRGHTLLAEAVDPWSVLECVDAVYTVSSQLGFEALLADLPVHCFGLPFYAGWGATIDVATCPRRRRCRTPIEIFAAAYLLYARYVDPFSGRQCALEDAIDLLSDLRRYAVNSGNRAVCFGFSQWKHRFVGSFLGAAHGTRISHRRRAAAAADEAARTGGRLVVWAATEPAGLAEAAARRGVPLARMEDGFLRSIGLGAHLVRPCSLVVDPQGIHYDPTRPSALETLLESGALPEDVVDRARRLRRQLVTLQLSKYNVGDAAAGRLPPSPGRRRFLVPGQVENDASVRRGSPVITSNRALLEAVRTAHPDAFIVYKPHPDVEAGLRDGALPPQEAGRWCDAIITGASIATLFEQVDEVHTMTSLAGFEALLRGLAVSTYGAPFYAGWGLTTDRMTLPRRRRRISLDELVAAALILYPVYVDPLTGRLCTVETVVRRLAEQRPGGRSVRVVRRLFARLLHRLRTELHTAGRAA